MRVSCVTDPHALRKRYLSLIIHNNSYILYHAQAIEIYVNVVARCTLNIKKKVIRVHKFRILILYINMLCSQNSIDVAGGTAVAAALTALTALTLLDIRRARTPNRRQHPEPPHSECLGPAACGPYAMIIHLWLSLSDKFQYLLYILNMSSSFNESPSPPKHPPGCLDHAPPTASPASNRHTSNHVSSVSYYTKYITYYAIHRYCMVRTLTTTYLTMYARSTGRTFNPIDISDYWYFPCPPRSDNKRNIW